MKTFCIILVLSIFTFISCKNNNELFKVQIEHSDNNLVDELKKMNLNKNDEGKLFNNDEYEIWKSCSGEWGGTIYFKNKLNSKIYSAISTCPISANKIKQKYYISNNLDHLDGYCQILEIINPEEMKETSKIPKYSNEISTRDYESHSNQGTKKIIDSSGVAIVSSFVYKDELYSIISNHGKEKTTISKIEKGKFATVLDLTSKINFTSEPIIIRNGINQQKIIFQNPKKGILEIKNNDLIITYYN